MGAGKGRSERRVNLFHYSRFSPRGSSDTAQLGRKCTSEFTEMVKDIYLLWKECICIGNEINLAVTTMFKYEFKTWLNKEIISFTGGYQEPVQPTGYLSVKKKYWFKIWDTTQDSLIALFYSSHDLAKKIVIYFLKDGLFLPHSFQFTLFLPFIAASSTIENLLCITKHTINHRITLFPLDLFRYSVWASRLKWVTTTSYTSPKLTVHNYCHVLHLFKNIYILFKMLLVTSADTNYV